MTAPTNDLIAAVEAMLFSADEPAGIGRLAEALGESSREVVLEAVQALKKKLEDGETSGVELVEVAGGYQLCTKPRFSEAVRRFLDRRRSSAISHAALETLAIIAYRQPISRADIQGIRGVDVSSAFKTLLERKLIRISGRKEAPGRPFIYSTTKQFLQYFGLKSIQDLPSFEDFQRMLAEREQLGTDEGTVHAIEDSLHLTHHGGAEPQAEEDGEARVSVESPESAEEPEVVNE